MTRRSFSQSSFFDPQFVDPRCAPSGTLVGLLAEQRSSLFPDSILSVWRGAGRRGRRAWPAEVLGALWLLRWSGEGMSRLASCVLAQHHAPWRAAMGLAMGGPTPSEKTMREFERFLGEVDSQRGTTRALALQEHWAGLVFAQLPGTAERMWAVDSTPMHCYGAVLDTVRLLGDGLRRVARTWARATRMSVHEVGHEWGIVELIRAKSTKGAFDIDWRQSSQRDEVVDQLARWAVEVSDAIRRRIRLARRSLRKNLLGQVRSLLRVISESLHRDEHGQLTIARKVARNRQASLTEPQARHGHKSKHRKWVGFKAHIAGDLHSGLIVSCSVTPANAGDASVAAALVRRAKRIIDELPVLLGDGAYTDCELRARLREFEGTEVIAPPSPNSLLRPEEHLVKNDFRYDADAKTATCPNDVATRDIRFFQYGNKTTKAPRARWSSVQCLGCPLESACPVVGHNGEHGVQFHPFESELQRSLEAWKDADKRTTYRLRARFERLIRQVTRRGARQARSFGLRAANLQLQAIVGVNNLMLLARGVNTAA